ncbi:unknown seed protein USP-like [Vicia villosa]|uniref:unknown seed protein USP-like n=1 Tax=Vicia villosa TaxID=3911 RepID=UPI00273B8CD1|nr:unknown seed protein USP-like [Vicia villosa]
MEFSRLSLLTFFCLAIAGIVASHSDIEGKVLFLENDLYPGKIFKGLQKLSDVQPFRTIGWLPIEKANQQSEDVIEKESYSLDEICGGPPAIGEDKLCATSLESMKDFAISKLGLKIKSYSGYFAKNQDQYVVEEVNKIADKGVMCHKLNLGKDVFYCHQVNASTTYMVPLTASDGTTVKALAACHHDTRGMNPNLLDEVLKVKPGTVPVCHFVGNKAVAWLPVPVTSDSNDHPCAI